MKVFRVASTMGDEILNGFHLNAHSGRPSTRLDRKQTHYEDEVDSSHDKGVYCHEVLASVRAT